MLQSKSMLNVIAVTGCGPTAHLSQITIKKQGERMERKCLICERPAAYKITGDGGQTAYICARCHDMALNERGKKRCKLLCKTRGTIKPCKIERA